MPPAPSVKTPCPQPPPRRTSNQLRNSLLLTRRQDLSEDCGRVLADRPVLSLRSPGQPLRHLDGHTYKHGFALTTPLGSPIPHHRHARTRHARTRHARTRHARTRHARTRHAEVVSPTRTPSHHHDRRAAGPLLIRGGNRSLAGTFSQERTHVLAARRSSSQLVAACCMSHARRYTAQWQASRETGSVGHSGDLGPCGTLSS